MTLDDLDEISVLGQGTYGRVTLVRDKTGGPTMALKQIQKGKTWTHLFIMDHPTEHTTFLFLLFLPVNFACQHQWAHHCFWFDISVQLLRLNTSIHHLKLARTRVDRVDIWKTDLLFFIIFFSTHCEGWKSTKFNFRKTCHANVRPSISTEIASFLSRSSVNLFIDWICSGEWLLLGKYTIKLVYHKNAHRFFVCFYYFFL